MRGVTRIFAVAIHEVAGYTMRNSIEHVFLLGEVGAMRKNLLRFSGFLVFAVAAAIGSAQTFTLTDTNTSARIVANSTMGLDQWNILGVDQVFSNTYMWRVGDGSTADYIQNLTLTNSSQVGNRFLDLTYTNNVKGFAIDITYVLTGGLTSFDLAEIVRVRNIGNNSLDFRLFQYNDFDLNNTSANDTVTRVNASQVSQVDGDFSLNMGDQGATPVPGRSQVGALFASSITGTSGYNLDTLAGNGLGQNYSGDAAYGFQWNKIINPGQSFTISTDKVAAVPEPASMAALALGAVALLRRRRSKK